MRPDSAWTMMSYPGREEASASSSPKAVREQVIRLGWAERRSSSARVFEGGAEVGHQARAEVLDHEVGPSDQPPNELDPLGGLEVQGDRALVPVETEEIRRVVPGEGRSPMACVVPLPGSLHLDHVRSEVSERHRDQGTG
jgi:hypothetical protein